MDYRSMIEGLDLPSFFDMAGGSEALTTKDRLTTMQINVGRVCNLACNHCHLEAGPHRDELMGADVAEACIEAFKKFGFQIADITGGAPEMNPCTERLIESLAPCGKVMVRSNLVILDDPAYRHYLDVYTDNKVELICSMPCYGKDGVEEQRGSGVYEPLVRILKELNARGYGKQDDLRLNLAYNPGGAFLPPKQAELEETYRKSLREEHGIEFDSLFTITNSALGRFGKRLAESGELESYFELLTSTFNKCTVANLMCLSQVSVGWDGRVYDCDGHQAYDLPTDAWDSIFALASSDELRPRVVKTAPHCFACTAGCGSSCGGSLA